MRGSRSGQRQPEQEPDRGNYWLEKKTINMNHNSVHDSLANNSFNRSSLQFSASNNLSHVYFDKDSLVTQKPNRDASVYSLNPSTASLGNATVYAQEKLAFEWVNQRDEILLNREKGETVASFVLKNSSEKNWMVGMRVELKFGEKNIKIEREIPHEVRKGEEVKVDFNLAEHQDADLSRDTAMLWIKGTDAVAQVKYFSHKYKMKIRFL